MRYLYSLSLGHHRDLAQGEAVPNDYWVHLECGHGGMFRGAQYFCNKAAPVSPNGWKETVGKATSKRLIDIAKSTQAFLVSFPSFSKTSYSSSAVLVSAHSFSSLTRSLTVSPVYILSWKTDQHGPTSDT